VPSGSANTWTVCSADKNGDTVAGSLRKNEAVLS
jgi:hypothetical protein